MRLPVGARNPVFLVGAALATATAALFVVFLLLDLLGLLTNPYAGLLVFVTIPVLFVVELLLMPFGAWLTRRRGGAADDAQAWPIIDLRNPPATARLP